MAFNDFGYWTETKALKRSRALREHAQRYQFLKSEEQITKHYELMKLHREFVESYGWSPFVRFVCDILENPNEPQEFCNEIEKKEEEDLYDRL